MLGFSILLPFSNLPKGESGEVTSPSAMAFDALRSMGEFPAQDAVHSAKRAILDLLEDACTCSVSSPFPAPCSILHAAPKCRTKEEGFLPSMQPSSIQSFPRIIQHIFPAGTWHILLSRHKASLLNRYQQTPPQPHHKGISLTPHQTSHLFRFRSSSILI